MIYFIYGEDSYRAKRKLEEIIFSYKKIHKSGLNLIYIDAQEKSFKDFYSSFKINSMFAEKKLIILKNVFSAQGANALGRPASGAGPASGWQEDFLENIKNLEETEDIVVVYENGAPDQRTKFFKALLKHGKCQEFDCLQPAMLKK